MTRRPPPRRPVYRIREATQLDALVSPVRQEIVDSLQLLGPCSIATLAEDLGRAPDSLYYHVRKLEQVGLVVQRVLSRKGPVRPGRADVLYDVPGDRVLIDRQPQSAEETETLLGLVGAVLRMAERDLRAAFSAGVAVYRRSTRRNAWGGRCKGWLTQVELAEVREHLDAVMKIVTRGKKRRGSSLHAVSFVLTPFVPSRRSAAGRNSPKGT
jgi:DNA-binding transcriptional ArsR family regulator